jgi:hypothetical protein
VEHSGWALPGRRSGKCRDREREPLPGVRSLKYVSPPSSFKALLRMKPAKGPV